MRFQKGKSQGRIAAPISIPIIILASALLFAIYEWAVFFSTFNHPGAIGINWNSPGSDWMVIYGAERSFIDHNFALIFDGERLTRNLNSTFSGWLSQPLSYHPFLYPPILLLLLRPFGYLGFLPSYAAFQIFSAAGLYYALGHNADRPNLRYFVSISALISPAAAITAVTGQVTFFVALCLVAGMRLADRRPALGAAFLGMLIVKPQFFLLVPIALVAARQWRCLLYLMLFVVLAVAFGIGVFGIEIWRQWAALTFQGIANPDVKWIEYGRLWGNSVYACALGFGLSSQVATELQLFALAASVAFVYWAYRSALKSDQKLAILLVASVLAAPHSGAYDGILLVIGSALWLVETRPATNTFIPWVAPLLLWMAAVFSPPYFSPPGRLVPIVIVIFILQLMAPLFKDRVPASKS